MGSGHFKDMEPCYINITILHPVVSQVPSVHPLNLKHLWASEYLYCIVSLLIL